MDPLSEQALKHEADMQIVRRELERRSKDIIRVHNPLDTPFRFKYDSFPHVIPAKGDKDMERYLAEQYRKKIIEHMIGQEQLKQGKELLELREKQLGKTFLDKYEENKEVWDRVPRQNDAQLIEAYTEIVVVGLVAEYGMEDIGFEDELPLPEKIASPFDDTKRFDRRIIDGEPMQRFTEDTDA